MMDLDLISKTDHIPVLIEPIIKNISPVRGVWIDATFGAGGYSRALLDAGADFVFAIDRDPNVKHNVKHLFHPCRSMTYAT